MTENEFEWALLGEGTITPGVPPDKRVKYVIADALYARAAERQRAFRPDKAGLLRYIADRIRAGQDPSKKSMRKASADIEVVRTWLVDGVAVSSLDH